MTHTYWCSTEIGWVGATNLNWKTRYVKISEELNDFHICKQNINTFDSNDIKYEVVQTCDVLNMKVYRINKFQYEKHSIPKNTTRCPLKIVTSKWSKKGKMFKFSYLPKEGKNGVVPVYKFKISSGLLIDTSKKKN